MGLWMAVPLLVMALLCGVTVSDRGLPSTTIRVPSVEDIVAKTQSAQPVEEILLLSTVTPDRSGFFCLMFDDVAVMLEHSLRSAGVRLPISRGCCRLFDFSCWRGGAPGHANALVRPLC